MTDASSDIETVAITEVEQRWRAIFETLVAGGEVPPAQRLRTEGMMETLVLLGIADRGELQARLERCYLDCYGEPLADDWQELFPFPQVPGFGQRAPVYPSTSD